MLWAAMSVFKPTRPFVYAPSKTPSLCIIYQDDDLLVLDKQSGLLTVAGKTEDLADCLEVRAQAEFPGARMVHRLDKDTSGVIVIGLNAPVHAALGKQFEKRQTKKEYIARVWGHIEEDSGRIDKPLATDWFQRPKQRVDYEKGKNAVTDWEVVQREEIATRVLLKPITGRSHQLRVHMFDMGHVILGDNLYANDEIFAAANRLQLHAERLWITHPVTGEEMVFHAPCPF